MTTAAAAAAAAVLYSKDEITKQGSKFLAERLFLARRHFVATID
jgi:hypothetical protein